MNATYRKNLKSIATACKNYTDTEITEAKTYTDEKVSDLAWKLGANDLSVETDTSTGYTSSVPSGTIAAKFTKVGGMSYKYNQLIENGNDYTTEGEIRVTLQNGKYTLNGTATDTIYNVVSRKVVSLKANHKYFLYIDYKGTVQSGTTWQIYLSNIISAYTVDTRIINVESDGDLYINTAVYDGATINCSFYQNLIDLTANGIDTTDVDTAKTQLLAMGYKLDGTDEYSTGKLRHAKVSSVDVLSRNLLDNTTFVKGRVDNGVIGYANETTSLTITDTGVAFTTSSNYRGVASGLIKVISNETYCISYDTTDGVYADMYDINENWISKATLTYISEGKYTFTTASNCAFIRISFQKATIGTTTISNIMLVSGSTAPTTFIPYVAPINKEIPSTLYNDTRWGLGYDSSNYNYLDLSNYQFKGNVGIVDMGTLNWRKDTNRIATTDISSLLKDIANTDVYNLRCSIYIADTFVSVYTNATDKIIAVRNGDKALSIWDSYWYNNWDAEAFKTAMSGVYLVYELATAFDEDKSSAFINWDNPIEFTDDYGTVQYTNEDELDLPYSITYLKEVAK